MDIRSYIDSLAAKGRYYFATEEAVAALGSSPVAARAAIRRLREKGLLAMPFRGFHLIVPPEYRAIGCLPADQFVPQLMEHRGPAYYAGLPTAASLHGAAHQAPMVFQTTVATDRPEIRCGRVRAEFAARANATEIPDTGPTQGPCRSRRPAGGPAAKRKRSHERVPVLLLRSFWQGQVRPRGYMHL